MPDHSENENRTEVYRLQRKEAFAKELGCLGVGTGRNDAGRLEIMLLVDGLCYTVPFDSALAFHLQMGEVLSKVRQDRETVE